MIVRAQTTQLTRETRFRRRLRLDTYGHYPKHAEAIRRWREQRQASGIRMAFIAGRTPPASGSAQPSRCP